MNGSCPGNFNKECRKRSVNAIGSTSPTCGGTLHVCALLPVPAVDGALLYTTLYEPAVVRYSSAGSLKIKVLRNGGLDFSELSFSRPSPGKCRDSSPGKCTLAACFVAFGKFIYIIFIYLFNLYQNKKFKIV